MHFGRQLAERWTLGNSNVSLCHRVKTDGSNGNGGCTTTGGTAALLFCTWRIMSSKASRQDVAPRRLRLLHQEARPSSTILHMAALPAGCAAHYAALTTNNVVHCICSSIWC